MLPVLGFVALIATLLVFAIAGVLVGYTAICMLAGAGVCFALTYRHFERERTRRRQEDRETLLALVDASYGIRARIEAQTVESPKKLIEQIRRG